MASRILIADDDLFVRMCLLNTFDSPGYEIATCSDGKDALKQLTEHEYDLAILDYHLPGMCADQILSEIRARDIDTPVIVITGDDAVNVEKNVRRGGACFFFVKPFSIEDVRQVGERILMQRKRTAAGCAEIV